MDIRDDKSYLFDDSLYAHPLGEFTAPKNLDTYPEGCVPLSFWVGVRFFFAVLCGELGTNSMQDKGVYVIFWIFRQEYGIL